LVKYFFCVDGKGDKVSNPVFMASGIYGKWHYSVSSRILKHWF